eukprot:6365427-Pyramimonas_sp.AAC.1
MPDGRPLRNQRRTEGPVSGRSGTSAISERDMLFAVLMVNADGQIALRVDEDTFENMPLSSQHPHMCDEYPSAWISEKHPITDEEARGYMNVFTSLIRNERALEQRRVKGTHGTTLSDAPGIF